MKLRIKGNSIRLRLSKSEVAKFETTGRIEEKTEFVDSHFTYALEAVEGINEIMCKNTPNLITVCLPKQMADEWTSTELVGMQNDYEVVSGRKIFLLIEKDFVCIDNTFEDQSDNYPNPNAACGPAAV
jgi:hypothetical protein